MAPASGEFLSRPAHWDGAEAVVWGVADVTPVERAERDALNQAEAAARAKRRFMAAASHQLRTPLHVALGRLQILTQRSLSPEDADLAEGALNACRRLLFNIDDVLDAAALESGAIALQQEAFNPVQAVQIAVAAVREDHHDQSIHLHLPARGSGLAMGDPRRVGRIAAALLEEAIRRRPDAVIELDLTRDQDGVSLSINAPGATGAPAIPDLSDTQPVDPLTIARALASAMGGMLVEHVGAARGWAASAYLPLAPAAPAAPVEKTGLSILVVEDNAGNRKLADLVLTALGHKTHMAHDGAEAVAAVPRQPFDLVLMDLAMPGMDGFEAARRIRKLDLAWAGLPIAALTASCTHGVQEAVAEAGMDAFLQKPLELARLAETIALLAGSVEPAEIHDIEHEHNGNEQRDETDRDHEALSARQIG
jgi:CheY-like chemotaxis protein